ncbi:MAG: pantoate--beta-alanine ligase [Tepidisphaeraceae bacterium]
MQVVRSIADARAERHKRQRVALVPTMGALHAGHLSLIDHAKKHASHVFVSIFVNPTQFGPREDFNKYPRPVEEDLAKCEAAGVDLVFNPAPAEMYRPGAADVVVDLPSLSSVLEGKHRPGHFKGVCQVVAKLFNILTPDVACLGQKDYQQLRIITAMVEALDWPIQIVGCPTLRDPDGLALSSRNQFLLPDERSRALSIPRGLMQAKQQVSEGIRQTNRLLTTMKNTLLDVGSLGRIPVSVDYVACVDPQTFKPVETITAPTLLAVAARVGTTRLIDNVMVEPPRV